MAKYAVAECNNGNFKILSEWTDNKQGAFVNFHDTCKNYWNSSDVKRAMVKVIDEDLNVVDNKPELIFHADELPAEDDTEVEPA